MLAQFTIEERRLASRSRSASFPAARHQAEPRLVRPGHLDDRTASSQLMHFTRRVGVDGLEGHTLQGGHVEHRFGGHARTLRRGGWLRKDAGFPTVRHQAQQRPVRRRHLDHHMVCKTRSHASL